MSEIKRDGWTNIGPLYLPEKLVPVKDDTRMGPHHFISIRSDGLTFLKCLDDTAGCIELVQQFDRLYGASVLAPRSPIQQMVDEATGKRDADMQAFMRFVWNDVFLRIPEIKQ